MQTRVLQEVQCLADGTFLFEVFLGSLVLQAQPARKGSPAMMEFQGRRERRVNQVCLLPFPFRMRLFEVSISQRLTDQAK